MSSINKSGVPFFEIILAMALTIIFMECIDQEDENIIATCKAALDKSITQTDLAIELIELQQNQTKELQEKMDWYQKAVEESKMRSKE